MSRSRDPSRVIVGLLCACVAVPLARSISNLGAVLHGGRTSMEVMQQAYIAASGAQLLGAPVAGLAAALFGGKRVLLSALFALALSSVWALVWMPPTVMVVLFAVGGFAQVAIWCAVIAVLADAREIERPWVVATSLSAAVGAGAVVGSVLVALAGGATLGLGAPLMLLAIAVVVRRTLRDPTPEVETRVGSNYRDVEVVERRPEPLGRARELARAFPLYAAVGVIAAIALARSLAHVTRSDLQQSSAIALAPLLAAVLAIFIARSQRFLVHGIVVPLGAAVLLSLTFLVSAPLLFPFAVATSVASAVAGGALPFVVGRDREGAPIVAGFALAAAHLGTAVAFKASGSGALVAALASPLLGLALTLWLARYAQR